MTDYVKLATENPVEFLIEYIRSSKEFGDEISSEEERADADVSYRVFEEIDGPTCVTNGNYWNSGFSELFQTEVPEHITLTNNKPFHQLGGITAQIVYEEGGGEGEGDYVERVIGLFKVIDENVLQGEPLAYICVNGSYNSYEGTEFNESTDWTTVTPKTKTVVYWS